MGEGCDLGIGQEMDGKTENLDGQGICSRGAQPFGCWFFSGEKKVCFLVERISECVWISFKFHYTVKVLFEFGALWNK